MTYEEERELHLMFAAENCPFALYPYTFQDCENCPADTGLINEFETE